MILNNSAWLNYVLWPYNGLRNQITESFDALVHELNDNKWFYVVATNCQAIYVSSLLDTAERTGDFHWYRLDKNPGVRPDPDGFWSHKQGESHVTDRDNQGQRITDPSKLDPLKNHRYQFVAFMTVTSDNLNIQGPLNCDKRLQKEYKSQALN